MEHVSLAEQRVFAGEVRRWLPGCKLTLLYRGSRDGLTPAAFHERCDGRGPTLSLVLSSTECVFGGYASLPWRRPDSLLKDWFGSDFVPCPDAFLFTVVNPYSLPVTRFPAAVNAGMWCSSWLGPSFGTQADGAALRVRSSRGHSGTFDSSSQGDPSLGFTLPPAVSSHVLTGTRSFEPADVEVWRVG